MYLAAYTRKCYAAATSLGMGGAGGGIIGVRVPCVHCAAAASLGVGGVGGY